MVGNEAGESAASRLIQDATPAYLVKLMQAGTEYQLSDEQRRKVGFVATVFIVIYGASVTLLSDVVGYVAPQADQTLRDILTLMPWAFSFPVAGLAALFSAKLLESRQP